ncbi:uncharacterized protein LOC124138448 isoform X2 [Haliotis rufescens]|uniref:uncharacterized protein LOC124138448 isoform X2 n=1 Tax=Haliotis rufescens TaxID=6454 RepID=UPI00201F3377|nr:uncharacterized protein LOC124138448 isoform X2 [Haliotis rufescens]
MIVLVLFSLGLSTAASLDCYNCNHYDVNNVQHSCQVLKCNKGEFCKMETDHSTKVHGHCEDIHQLAHCHATPSCIPFHENKCTFCCDTDEEVHKTLQQPTESLACYNCHHYDVNSIGHSCEVLHCGVGEFCKMETDHNSKVTGTCAKINEMSHCQEHVTSSCIPFYHDKCTFCCSTGECISNSLQVPAIHHAKPTPLTSTTTLPTVIKATSVTNVRPSEYLECYNCHYFDVNNIYHSCEILHCGFGEFCKMETDHNNKVTGTCSKVNEMRHCQEHVTSSCIPFVHDKCTFCCATGECVSQSLQLPATHHAIPTPPTTTSTTTLPTVVQAASKTTVRPLEYLNCYNCHHFDVNNIYYSCEILHCGFGEFCKMETDHNNKVTGTCAKVNEMRHCQEHVTSSCIPFVHDKCTFCCATGECVSQSLQLPAIHHPKPTSTITLPTVVQATSKITVRPSEYLKCYNCHNIYYSCEILHCGFGEFCMMETDHDAKVTGKCSSVNEMNHCQEHVTSSCIPFYHHKCTFCCSTGNCVSQALQLLDTSHNPTPTAYHQSTTSTPATTSTGGMISRSTHLPDTSHNPTPTASTTSTPATTSTGGMTSRSTHLPVTTKPVDPCQDHDPICSTMMGICSSSVGRYMCGKTCNSCSTGTIKPVDPCQDHDPICSTMMDICSNPVGRYMCGKTCNSCSTGTTKPVDPCQDHDPVCTTIVGICNNPIGPHMCGKTCNSCSTAAATTGIPSAPTTTSATTTATTPAAKSGSSSSTISVSTLSVSTPPAATNGNTSAHVTTASARTSTTGKPSHRTCYQCGDINKGTFCTIGQIIMPSSSPCPADKAFCMTDLFHHIDGSTKYIRRCVAQVMCLRQWYQQTSDKSECVDVDPTTISTDITCRYCCTTDDCNSGNMPVRNTLYKPKH